MARRLRRRLVSLALALVPADADEARLREAPSGGRVRAEEPGYDGYLPLM